MKKLTKRELKKEAAKLHDDILAKDAARQEAFLAEKFPKTEETAKKESFTHWKPLAIVSAVLILVLTGGIFLISYFREKPSPASTFLRPESFAFGYEYETEQIEWGERINSFDLCAFSAPSDTFDINDVTLDFSFGWHWESPYVDSPRNIPGANIFFFNHALSEDRIIYRSFENYTSESYRCFVIYDDEYRHYHVNYNHTESITIPKEIFVGDKGAFFWGISGKDLNKTYINDDYDIAWFYFFYTVNGSNITLSLEEPETELS